MNCKAVTGVKNTRLKQLILQVWERLPEHDQHTLNYLIAEINESYDHFRSGSGESVEVSPDFVGPLAQFIESSPYAVVTLGPLKDLESDAAAMAVIAHEFAHVILRHHQLGPIADLMEVMKLCSSNDANALTHWYEDQAELQIWLWGFQKEMEIFYILYPKSRRPRWIVPEHKPKLTKRWLR